MKLIIIKNVSCVIISSISIKNNNLDHS